MKRNRIAFSVLAFIAMLMVLAVPAAAQNVVYFDPDNSGALDCSDVTVDLMAGVDASNPISMTAVNITFDPSCVDITDWIGDNSVWAFNTSTIAYSIPDGYIFITTGRQGGVSGNVKMGTLTLRCNDTGGCCPDGCCCGSWLNITNSEYTNASNSATIIAATDNGTFMCGDGITVTKKIWNGSGWADNLGPLASSYNGTDVRFNITVTAGCLALSGVVINDTMNNDLVYNNSASWQDDSHTAQTVDWTIGTLNAHESNSTEFNATIIGYRPSCNTATATGTVTSLGVEVDASDDACETTNAPAGIDVNKTVWNPVIGQWVDVLAMQVIDELDIGDPDPGSEAGHSLYGWGPVESATSGGNYGGVANPPEDGTCRVAWYNTTGSGANQSIPPTLPDPNGRMANFTMNNPGHAKQLQLRVLDGGSDDSFDVYINGIEAYSYAWSGNTTEFWVTHEIMVPVSERNNPLAITINSTGPKGGYWYGYGQLAVQWAKLYTWPQIGDTYRFRCEMHNIGSAGMNLANITVWDVLSDSLSYAGNAKLQDHHGVEWDINPPDFNYSSINNTYGWIIDNWVPGESLQPCQTIVIEFDATVVDYGYDCNEQIAEAWCNESQTWVEGNDTACIDTPMPDLNVTAGNSIKVNPDVPYMCDMAFGPTDHPGKRTQCNNISAEVAECNGVDIVLPFNVTIVVTNSSNPGVEYANCTTTLPGLAGGTEVTVWCNNSWYPTAGWDYTINVTADPADVIPESDENNNTLLRDVTPYVYGWKGNSHQDGRNITTLQYHNGTVNLVYSEGNSAYMGSAALKTAQGVYLADWTVDPTIPTVDTTIKKARLYVYYNWDKTAGGNVSDYFTMKFNGYTLPRDEVYIDQKMPVQPNPCCPVLPDYYEQQWPGATHYTVCGSNYPYGMAAYDVTHKFKVGDINSVNLTSEFFVWDGKMTSINGMLLVVVYDNPDEPERVIWINEGYDMLASGLVTYAKYVNPTVRHKGPMGITPEEATTYAPFAGYGLVGSDNSKATLITAVTSGSTGAANGNGKGHSLYFNDYEDPIGVDYVWSGNVATNETNIPLDMLSATDNTAAFRSYGDGFNPANAFLIVQKAKPGMSVEPEPPASGGDCYNVNERFDVLVNITPLGEPIMGAQFDLHFNASVLWAETVTYGDFLTQGGTSVTISHSDVDNLNGVVSFAAARQGTTIGVTTPGTFAIVTFTAVTQGATSYLDLRDVLAADNNSAVFGLETTNSTAKVCSNPAPVAVAKSDFTYNNIAERGLSKAYFNGTDSHDIDPGTITEYEWWVDDGTDLVGMVAVHLFEVPMYWQGGGYVPAQVRLTVIDDGEPLMEGNDTIPVTVWIAGDTNGDGIVNIGDTVTFGIQFGKQAEIGPDGLRWHNNPAGDKADLNNDEWVNIGDAMLLGTSWGHTAW